MKGETKNKRTQYKQPLDEVMVKKICEFETRAQDRTLWRTRFGRGNGPLIRQITL